jgi:hypothetical protein
MAIVIRVIAFFNLYRFNFMIQRSIDSITADGQEDVKKGQQKVCVACEW